MAEEEKKLPAISGSQVAKLLGGIARSSPASALGRNTLLKMSVLGVWQMGQTNDVVQQGSRWLVAVPTLRHGNICWRGGKIIGETMVPANEDAPELPPPHHSPGEDPAPYKPQISVLMRCMNGEDAGTQVIFKTSSLGGTEELKRIVGVIEDRAAVLPDTPFMFPIVELKNSSYANKKKGGGLTFNPVLDVVGWADADGNIEEGEDDEPEAAAAAPPIKTKPPIAESPQPQRRRRA